jgi:hypothetical protein
VRRQLHHLHRCSGRVVVTRRVNRIQGFRQGNRDTAAVK